EALFLWHGNRDRNRLPSASRMTSGPNSQPAPKARGFRSAAYFRLVAFNIPRRSRRPSVNEQELAKINTALGKIGGNLNQLAHQAHLGSWPDSRVIEQMRDDLRAMRFAVIGGASHYAASGAIRAVSRDYQGQ